MLYLVALLLTVWFWRRNLKDANIWMIATYAGVALMAWTDYNSAAAMEEVVPKIVRDFVVIGLVGLVQSLAVARRMPLWLAILLTLGMFTFLHLWDKEGDPFVSQEQAVLVVDQPDPQGELLVELVEGADAKAFIADVSLRKWNTSTAFVPKDKTMTLLDNYLIVDVQDLAAAEKYLAGRSDVAWFEPNEVVQVSPSISGMDEILRRNPRLSINDPETEKQWVMEVMNMEAYYKLLGQQKPTKRAKIAILDTGVDSRHEDIKDNFTSIQSKYDNDPVGHGTHCAGIAAGVTNNGIGIGSLAGAGSRNFVEVTSIKVLNASGMGTQKSIIAGIIEATDEGADVISLSLGGPSNQSRQR
ncbi:MAG: S8 family serine peptidase, partial [Bacteroidota bacterium]